MNLSRKVKYGAERGKNGNNLDTGSLCFSHHPARSPRRAYGFQRDKIPAGTPQKHNIPFDKNQIPAKSGAELYGWRITSTPRAPTLVLIHGWGRNLSGMLPYTRALHPFAYTLLAFDARNHGNSSPLRRPTVCKFSEDALAARLRAFAKE